MQGEHAKGRGGLLVFSLIVRPRHFFLRPLPPSPPKKWRLLGSLWLATIRGPILQRLGACQSTEWTCRRRSRGWGDKGSFVLHWFFCNEFEDVQERVPTQVPNHDKLVDAQTTLWPSLTIGWTNVHLDSCSLTIAHALLPAMHEKLDLHKFTRCKYGAKKCKLGGSLLGVNMMQKSAN